MQLRDTKARFRRRVKFLGVEGGVLPLVISGGLSVFLVSAASLNGGGFPLMAVGALPFCLVYAYLALFVTGQRPHWSADQLRLILHGRAVPTRRPADFPQHPALTKSPRGIRQHAVSQES
jgi:hypothetical protein